MFIVSGASGNTGRVVAESLLAAGKQVTVLVRDEAKGEPWRARGAAVAVADLADTATLTRLLAAADGAYLLSPPANHLPDILADRGRLVDGIAAAVAESGIPQVVFLSSIGAQHPAGTGPIRGVHYAEQVLTAAARGATFLRAAYFLDNWGGAITGPAGERLVHNFLTPGRAVPMISTTDIGRFAARYLLDPAAGARIVEIAAPADYTPEDIADAAGPGAKLLTHPLEAVVPTFQSFGFSPNAADLCREMIEGFNSGHVAFEGDPQRGTVTAEEAIRSMLA